MEASQITKLLQKQNTRYINRNQTVDSSTLIWKNQIQSSKYIKGVKTCDGEQNWNVPTNPGCPVGNGVCSFGGSGRTTAIQTGSPQQFLNVLSGATGSASQVYSSESITMQRAGRESCGVAPTNPAPQNSYVVLPGGDPLTSNAQLQNPSCSYICTNTNGPVNGVEPPINNNLNPYLPQFDTYYKFKNAICNYPVPDQNQKHFVKQCHSRFPNANNGVNAVFNPDTNTTYLDPITKKFMTKPYLGARWPDGSPNQIQPTCDGCIIEPDRISNDETKFCPLLTDINSLGEQDIFVQIQLGVRCPSYPKNLAEIKLQGTGTINWGDGTIESFDSPDDIILLNHTYDFTTDCAQYILGFTGNIISLILSEDTVELFEELEGGKCSQNYPNSINAIINNAPLLTTLYMSSYFLENVAGLEKCTALINLELQANVNYSPIYTLPNLRNLALSDINSITTSFNATGLSNLTSLQLYRNLELSNIIGLNTLTNLTGLSINYCPFTDIDLTSNTNLNILNINNTLIYNNSTDFLNSLLELTNLTEFTALNTLFDNSSTVFLSNLPVSLLELNLAGTQFTGTFIIPTQLINLQNLYIPITKITSLPTLPSTLIRLNCSSTLIASLPTLPSTLIGLNCSSTLISSLPTLPSRLTDLICSDCNINQANADSIVANLVANGKNNGQLFIQNQSNGIILNITGGNWDILISRGWTIN